MSEQLEQLRAAQPRQVLAAALEAAREAEAAFRLTQALAIQGATLDPAAWDGPAARLAAAASADLLGVGRTLADAWTTWATRLARVAGEVETAQAELRQAHRVAAAHGAAVLPDGRLVGPPDLAPAAAHQIRGILAGALSRYAACSGLLAAGPELPGRRWGAASLGFVDPDDLGHAARPPRPDPAQPGTAGVDPALPDPPAPLPAPPPVTPGAAVAWWAGLSDGARRRVLDERPEWVGPLDGAPAWARDRANRQLLERAEQAATAELLSAVLADPAAGDVVGPGLTPQPRTLAVREAQDRLADLAAVRALLADASRQRQLLVLDTTTVPMSVAVSTGDVDTAGSLAVLVPGFRTTIRSDLTGHDAQVGAAVDVATGMARAQGKAGPVVGITWLGYPAPQTVEVLSRNRTVLGTTVAVAAAPHLAAFLQGLSSAATGAGRTQRVVLWGHSYGSTVVGVTLRDLRPPVSAVAVFGSPGLGVRTVEQLGLPAGTLFVAEAPADPVTDSGWFGTDPDRLRGAFPLSTRATTLPDGTPGAESRWHVDYLRPGSTSAWNLAAVAADTPSLLVRGPVCPIPVIPAPRECAGG